MITLRTPLAIAALGLQAGLLAQMQSTELPINAPTSLILEQIVFDTEVGRLIGVHQFTGGLVEAPSGTATWTPLPPAPNAPPLRYGATMAYDSGRARLIMFGGLLAGSNTDEVWELSATGWQMMSVAAGPQPRSNSVACYRADRGAVMFYGGWRSGPTGGIPLDDTWEYDGSSWQLIATGGLPAGASVAFAADTVRETVVAFDGASTLELGANGWTTVQPMQSPPPRSGAGMTYDPRRRRCVLYGGITGLTGPTQKNDFWEYDGATWLQRTPTPLPALPRYAAYMHYDPVAREVLIASGKWRSGNTVTALRDVIQYGPTVAAEAISFAAGCPTLTTPELQAGELPWLGRTAELQLLISPSAPALFVLGNSNTTTSGMPLPISLNALGLQGCSQLVSLDAAIGTMSAPSGQASIDCPIPNTPALLNARAFAQVITLGPGTTSGLIATNGLELVVGSF